MSQPPNPQYPTIAFVLARRAVVVPVASLVVFLVLAWIAYRSASVEIGVLSVLAALAVYFGLKLLIEIVALVADTLMPR